MDPTSRTAFTLHHSETLLPLLLLLGGIVKVCKGFVPTLKCSAISSVNGNKMHICTRGVLLYDDAVEGKYAGREGGGTLSKIVAPRRSQPKNNTWWVGLTLGHATDSSSTLSPCDLIKDRSYHCT